MNTRPEEIIDSEVRDLMGLLRNREPVMNDPEGLTNAIMDVIEQGAGNRATSTLFILQRLLAAASFAIVLLFGVEQYIVVEKIDTLEKQLSGTRRDQGYPSRGHLASAGELSKAGISFSEIERFLSPHAEKTALSSANFNKQKDLKDKK